MKTCEKCKKNSRNDAKKCKYCGFEFKNAENDLETIKEETTEIQDAKMQNLDNQVVSNQNVAASKFAVAFNNLRYWLSFLPAVLTSAALLIVCILAMIYFNGRRISFASNLQLVQSCIIMMIIFGFFLVVFATSFVASIVFNIQRAKRIKNKKGLNK